MNKFELVIEICRAIVWLVLIALVCLIFLIFSSCASVPKNQPVHTINPPPVVSVACPATRIIGKLTTKLDNDSLATAKTRCKYHYPKSPCLKLFKKTSPSDYIAICGPANK